MQQVTLIGRPNVGKSALFNALTRSREALVLPTEGLTRDRKSQMCRWGSQCSFQLNDVAGLAQMDGPLHATQDSLEGLMQQAHELTLQTIQSSCLGLLVVDAKIGLHPIDSEILRWLRKTRPTLPLLLIVNKSEGQSPELALASFFPLGLEAMLAVSARQHIGLRELRHWISEHISSLAPKGCGATKRPSETEPVVALQPSFEDSTPEGQSGELSKVKPTKVVLLGRPNVGKSSLMNAWLKQPRVLTNPLSGTTRENIAEPLEFASSPYTLVDTAGVRKRTQIEALEEKFGVQKSLEAARTADIVLLVSDATESGTRQELTLLQRLLRDGIPTVLVLNQADKLDKAARREKAEELQSRLRFAAYLPLFLVSAKYNWGLVEVLKFLDELKKADLRFGTSLLNRALDRLVTHRAPPAAAGSWRRPKLKYIHQHSEKPLKFTIHGTKLETLPDGYRKFIENGLRSTLNLPPVPLLLHFSNQPNPYAPIDH